MLKTAEDFVDTSEEEEVGNFFARSFRRSCLP